MGIKIQTIKDIRVYLTKELEGIYPERELNSISGIVIRSALGSIAPHRLYMPEEPVSARQAAAIVRICDELKTGKPVQYILGETVFYNCRIKLNGSTLIPRPETEELVDLVIRENKGFTGRITDFGTGSGCIAIALAANLPGSQVTGTDISEEALKMAEKNARLNKVKVTFLKEDILRPETGLPEKTRIIVSNPPYVMNSEKKSMHKNVLGFEPHPALFVKDQYPLVFYEAILRKAAGMDPGGRIYFEINESMGSQMLELVTSSGFGDARLVRDINDRDRIIRAVKT